MPTQPNDGLLYLQTYPQFRKWVVQCVACQRIGHAADSIEKLENHIAKNNLKRYFPAMSLDGNRLCEQCSAIYSPPIPAPESGG